MKLIEPDSVKYALLQAMNGDESELVRVNKT
jgi:hypothetical protein